MTLLLGAVGLLLLSGCAALFLNRFSRYATFIGVAGAVVSCVVGLFAVIQIFISGQTACVSFPLSIPYASFSVELDFLSAFFLLPVLFLSALAAIYGAGYLKSWYGKKSIGTSWFFYNLLVASMIMVVIARNAVLFLFFWEVMTIASYFLVTFENEKTAARKAGLIYLAASQAGTMFLLALFILLGQGGGGPLDFNLFKVSAGIAPSVIFILAILGFGVKAGFMPLHVWLPEAHPAAPSHVSALMSGAMIKMGIYGLIRVLMFLGAPSLWWGIFLIGVGITCGIFGLLCALAQRDLKRLLAYSSIENIGIITLGLGLGVLGMSLQTPVLIILGWAGALLHVVNHALFKSLLFFGAGVIVHAEGTREIDCMGGLFKKMPSTGICFLIGSAAICGLPLLNGFASEFLIYLGSFYGIKMDAFILLSVLGVIASLALIGGLAVACFSKAFGIIFLGEPRTPSGEKAREAGWLMRLPMMILGLSCVLIGLLAPFVILLFIRVLPEVTGLAENIVSENIHQAANILMNIAQVCVVVLGFIGIGIFIRRCLLKGRSVKQAVTWDCGYAAPSPRMQYTASSFAQPLVDLFSVILWRRRQLVRGQEIFPKDASLSTTTPDIFVQSLYRPILEIFYRQMSRLRFFQHGRLQIYILYIILTLLVLFVWKLW